MIDLYCLTSPNVQKIFIMLEELALPYKVKRLYEVLETRLGKSPYLGGDEYSIADIATFPWTRNHDNMGVKWENNPNLKRWFESVSARPAVKKMIEIMGGIKSNRETASD